MIRSVRLCSFISLALLSLNDAIAQVQKVTALPFTTELAPIIADGLEIPKQRIQLNELGGWLVASLTAMPDEVEWKIVLARISPEINPEVSIHPQLPLLSIQYGPYFIRESIGRLRVYREPKVFDDGTWSQIGDAPNGETPCTAGQLFVVKKEDCFWLCTSPKLNNRNIDTLIRFQHQELSKGHGSMMFADGKFSEVFCGEARCHDEFDLLVASRTPAYAARSMLSKTTVKQSIVGQRMPAINGERVGKKALVEMSELEGKVVLIDFWATWCGPCVKKLPEINTLQQRYRNKGLVVLGVHAKQNSGDLVTFMNENELEFPVVLSDGKTEERFSVSQFPTYFLVGRDGKVVSAFLFDPPPNDQIEIELAKSPSK